MSLLRNIAGFVLRWLEAVAGLLVATIGRFVSPRVVRLVEQDDGSGFMLRLPNEASNEAFKHAPKQAGKDAPSAPARLRLDDPAAVPELPESVARSIRGNRVEIVLRPSRFVFRQLELPRRAIEFLDGIVRAQIDRLTPWAASDAVFGWGRPADVDNDRIAVMVAATARTMVRPILQAVSGMGAASIAVMTAPADGAAADTRIKVYDQSVRGLLDARRVSRFLLVLLLVAAGAASVALAADFIVGGDLEARQSDLARSINARRVELRGGQNGPTHDATALLDRRKRETPATVIVLEALSEILPDDTYVSELHVEGNKLQIVGVTRDAPGLIRLIEHSPHFTHATFFAPTTRAPTDPGDRFHIEAHIEPVNTPRS
jgi:general secretion pathway protein L